MVSIPILIGDHVIGVFNVVTEPGDAFDVADVNYLTSLGAVIQTAVGVAVKDAKETPIEQARSPLNATPRGGVGSGGSVEEMEASDD